MRHEPFAEERRDAPARAVEKLVGNHEIERPVLLLQRSHGAQRENALDAERLHPEDVRAKVQLRWRDAMPARMARQEGDLAARESAQHVIVGGLPERRLNGGLLLRLKSRHRVQTAAADDSDLCCQCPLS